MFRPGRTRTTVPAEEEARYEDPIAAAFASVLEHEHRLARERSEAAGDLARLLCGGALKKKNPEVWTWGLCEKLLEESWALRQSDPAGMLALAKLAVEGSQQLDARLYGRQYLIDLQTQAWADLANALRVSDQLGLAEAAIRRAFELRSDGTGSPLLRARLAELSASLLCDQRQFPAAFRLLDLAHGLYRKHNKQHEAGRVLIKRGMHTGYTGDPEDAIRWLARGLHLIDRNRDPKLAFQVLHNILWFRVELGEFRTARLQLWEMRPLYWHHADRIAHFKLRWMEGKIFVGLSQFDNAEAAFSQARESFEGERLRYDAALVSFDLATLWLMQGKKAEVHRLVTEMLETFRARYIAREAIAALLMLREAVNRDEATVDLFQFVSTLFKSLRDEDSKPE